MHTQNYFITASKFVSGGGTQPIKMGYPEQSEMLNDICLCKKGSGDFIRLNSLAFRTALLNSKEFLEKYLHVKVLDTENVPEEKPVAKTPKKSKQKVEEDVQHD